MTEFGDLEPINEDGYEFLRKNVVEYFEQVVNDKLLPLMDQAWDNRR